jgi:hypothetical protein
MNMAVAKFNAQYRSQGVHFLSICPGSVEVGRYNNCTISLRTPLDLWGS